MTTTLGEVLPRIEEYLATQGIYPDPYKSKGSSHDRVWYHCPFHEPDHDPSFYISRTQNVWRCPVCAMGGGVKRLVALLEFHGGSDRQTWQAVSRRCDELTGRMSRLSSSSSPSPQGGGRKGEEEGEREETALSARALHALDHATAWWHERLWDPTRGARAARAYLISRGVSCRAMQQRAIGYVPHDPGGSYARALLSALSQEGKEEDTYGEEVVRLGLFAERKAAAGYQQQQSALFLRFQGRIMFSSCDHEGHTRYFQGRIVGKGDDGARYKYLGAPLPKYPFSLLPGGDEPLIRGTVGTESPMGPLVLYGYGVPALATCGTGIPSWVLARFTPPLYWAQDHDLPKERRMGDGSLVQVFPGEEQAKRALEQCHLLGIPAYRIRPPAHVKGLDEWLAQSGSITPLLEAIHNAVIISKEGEKGGRRGLSNP